ncbi:MAG: hypothetical protein VXW72_01510, partial [Candidatus Thermoplasmatota archaeon]|nr:hypothetical protein [Candidatus Thermoplasmatota archaeon]
MEGISPGQHELRLVVAVEGGTGFASFDFTRTNDPIEFENPLPELLVPQRGSVVLNVSDIANDPDGQIIRIMGLTLLENESHFSAVVNPEGTSLTLFHSVDEEWEGATKIGLVLEADGDVLDQANVTINASILPVNDQIVQLSTIDQQTLVEDGASWYLNYENYFFDPEQQPLTVLINGAPQGTGDAVSWSVSSDLPIIEFTPLPDANGAEVFQLSISDGFNPPIIADVPLRIEAVDDDFVVDETAWSVSMQEEETLLIDLFEFASDVDGDVLTWTVEPSGESIVAAAVSGQELLLSALLDTWGTDEMWWLNVTDGTTTYSKLLNVSIEPMPDQPTISNASASIPDASSLRIAWDWYDADGDEMDVEIQINGVKSNGSRECSEMGACTEINTITFDPGSIINIDIIARDSEFQDVVVRLNSIRIVDTTSTNTVDGDNSESGSNGTFVAAIIIVPLVAIVGWLLLQFRKPPQKP